MKQETPCMICSGALARCQCRKCGSLVCEKDYNAAQGLCVDCAKPLQ